MPFFMAGKPNFARARKSRTKEIEPQMSSLAGGRIGLGASWHSSTEPPPVRMAMQ
jgi:hypothetical protein